MTENKNVRIPMVDFKAQYKSIEKEIDAAIKEVLLSGQYILGPAVKEFEEQVTAYCGVKYAIGVASGSDALILSLRAFGIGPGDEVITTPFTFVATAHAIVHCGAKPVFVDIEPDTFNINPALIEPAITKNTKAIIPVHLYGHPANMDPIMEIAKTHNLYVVEDAAQAFGARYNGKQVGSIGHVGCFSFFPTKNLGCYGDGGMVVTDNPDIADKVDILRRQGCREKYHAEMIGYNSRLDTIQAAILKVKLRYVDQWNEKRRYIAKKYNELLSDTNITTPVEAPYAYHVYHQYTIRSSRRDDLKQLLFENDIDTSIYYPKPLHLQDAYKCLENKKGSYPESERAGKEVLSLPISPEISEMDQEYIIQGMGIF
ncbi:MAG: DegT/DnrJ/EryC1/StrS family aminotransferase [Candidatus Aminicenantes bacterium]|nr:DegT/DnrJ/EryC1/StrS family aminotransferase [Candidatus Aminicenantes bacterium]